MIRSLVFAGIAAISATASVAAPVYKIEAIPSNLQFTPTTAIAINKKGEAVGEGKTANGNTVLYKYSNGKVKRLSNDKDVRVSDINDLGDILGSYDYPATDQVIWHADGTRQQMNLGPRTYARALNNLGQMAGSAPYPLPDGFYSRPALYSNGAWTDLGSVGPYDGGGEAVALNDSGSVLGNIGLLNGEAGIAAFVWKDGGKKVIGLTVGDFHWNEGTAINSKGHAVGTSDYVAFIYNGTKSKRLPTPPTGDFIPTGLNSLDEVVGNDRQHYDATLTTGGETVLLSSTLDASGADWTDLSALDINDRGQIVGSGYYKGQQRAFIAVRQTQ